MLKGQLIEGQWPGYDCSRMARAAPRACDGSASQFTVASSVFGLTYLRASTVPLRELQSGSHASLGSGEGSPSGVNGDARPMETPERRSVLGGDMERIITATGQRARPNGVPPDFQALNGTSGPVLPRLGVPFSITTLSRRVGRILLYPNGAFRSSEPARSAVATG